VGHVCKVSGVMCGIHREFTMVLGRSNLKATGLICCVIVNGPAHLGRSLLQPVWTILMFLVDSITLSPTLKCTCGFRFGLVMLIIRDRAACSISCVCATTRFIASVN
jgi:hypothetical protein